MSALGISKPLEIFLASAAALTRAKDVLPHAPPFAAYCTDLTTHFGFDLTSHLR